mmetsp:Transcript_57674/g.66313  ORF Transcript_57674/g.66313 Transcript_57674/m.66313 type:complete len:82 (-) Transcript_57674:945-1190(-)
MLSPLRQWENTPSNPHADVKSQEKQSIDQSHPVSFTLCVWSMDARYNGEMQVGDGMSVLFTGPRRRPWGPGSSGANQPCPT